MIVKNRYPVLPVIAAMIITLATGCVPEQDQINSQIKQYIDSIWVINTHEHQRIPAELQDHSYNFYTLLCYGYLNSDLISAGSPFYDFELIKQGDLDGLWDRHGQYLDFSRNTSYYSHFLAGFRILYDFREPYFTKENIRDLSAQIEKNYGNIEQWYEAAFRKSGFELMFVDQYWNPFNMNLDTAYFALVFNINRIVTDISNRDVLTDEDASQEQNTYALAEKEGYVIQSLDDYLVFVDHLFDQFISMNTVCIKNSLAYSRTLDFAYVSYERANGLFSRPSTSLSGTERKELQDFMFHRIIEKSIELDLPIQIHTGYLAGNGNRLENSRPTKLNNLFLRYPDARFVLFHGGYPWTGEYAALGKMFSNVYLDIVWLPQISREAAVRSLDEMLDCVPYNKFFWGGDCCFIEESAGSLEFGKDVVAEVLEARINRGLMTEEVARDIARSIFRENAIRFFNLEEKWEIGF